MKQVAQRAGDGSIQVVEAPVPSVRPGWVLVSNRCSLISAGTERSKVELGEKTLLQKARARPDLVRKVVDRARVEGVRPALEATRQRLDALRPIGYSSAGIVVAVGEGVTGVAPGDAVACGGGGWANHAQVVAVPRTLVARIPDGVKFEAAAYATVGAVALHGIRQAESVVGDAVGVIGLGLVGQLAVRLLLAAGCEAHGIDLDPDAVSLAAAAGARAHRRDEPGLEHAVVSATRGLGLDAVLVCAATSSGDPLALAAALARDRGRLVVVGDVPIAADRALLYEKELELRISRSYGPGRYDRDYEEHARDLPAGYVRWTQQRNLEAFLDLIAMGRLDPVPLTTHRFQVEDAASAYEALLDEGDRRAFGIVLEYEPWEPPAAAPDRAARAPGTGAPRIAVIGAGSFARGTLLPAFRDAGAELVMVASERGLSAVDAARRFAALEGAASVEEIIGGDVDAVVVATHHAQHAQLVVRALEARKAVFVEKPLALTRAEADAVSAALAGGGMLMVGFNRRYAPLVERLRRELPDTADRVLHARVNAGPLPAEHWLHDPEEGGGRLLGEGCHFVDLLSHLGGARVVRAHAMAVPQPAREIAGSDSLVATLQLAGGAVASLVYAGGGDPRLPKERIEVFAGGTSAVLDDFRTLEIHAAGKRSRIRERQDKGHRAQVAHFVAALAGEAEPPSAESYLASTRATLALAESLRTGLPVEL